MNVYLPIAEQSADLLVLLGIGGGVGLLSGIFGVGGGFILTPLLMLMGIPPVVAVATGANQIVGSSVSGVIAHWRRRNVDVLMALLLSAGGLFGSVLGVWLFAELKRIGQADLVIALLYVVLLGSLGLLMLIESARTIVRSRKGLSISGRRHRHTWFHRLPLRMRFPGSRLYASALLPAGLGFLAGVMTAIMGVGGGFMLVPAMIYLVGMPTAVVVGTSLLQITLVSGVTTVLQAMSTHAVDVVLALILLVGGIVGAQVGARISATLKGEQLRFLLALLVLAVGTVVATGLVQTPPDPYSLDFVLE